MQYSIKKQKGLIPSHAESFTLVELMVAVSVFIIVVSIVVGIFVQALRMEGFISNIMEAQSNASIALEQIARELRVGYEFNLSNTQGVFCSGAGEEYFDTISFRKSKIAGAGTTQVTYRWHQDDFTIERREDSNPFFALTAPNVSVKRLCFALQPRPRDEEPWRVSLFLQVASTDPRVTQRSINLQTTVAARNLPNEVRSQ